MRPSTRLSLIAALGLSFTAAHAAVTLGKTNIQVGGFVSQGYLVNTGHNDYFGNSSDGTADFREYALNASWAKGQFRLGAQAFGQKLGDYGNDDIVLDWATVDWQPAQWVGFRAGRVKTPRGLHNEALDVDSVRPFVLLPQSVYDARLRDFNASFDGGMVFGNVSLRSLGSIDYKIFYGDVPMKVDSGANDYFNNDAPFPNVAIGMDSAMGGSAFWNTPVSGLRVGYSYSVFENFGADRDVGFAGMSIVMFRKTDEYIRHLGSVEYSSGDWTFAAEGGKETALYQIGVTGSPSINAIDNELLYGYVSASRRLGDKWEAGAYYSYSREEQVAVGFVFDLPALVQHDYTASIRYAFNDRWIVKAEVHYIDGAGKIFTTPAKPVPVNSRDTSWMLFAFKTTYSF